MRIICAFLLLVSGLRGFTLTGTGANLRSRSIFLHFQQKDQHEPVSMRDLAFQPAIQASKAVFPSLLATLMLQMTQLKPAVADSLQEINERLTNYGFPPILFVPDGFKPLISEYGRGNIKEAMSNPILVQFAYPGLWVVQKTSVNNNGEAGTISANDYIKGDSAYLFVQKLATKPTFNQETIRSFILKALSQKGDPVESLKIFQVDDTKIKGVDGQPYVLVDFGYQLNTEAGFLISRRAIASLTSVGEANNIQGLIAATTDLRWGSKTRAGLEGKLRTIAESFRVYRLNSGIFALEVVEIIIRW